MATIRVLDAADADAFRALRLEALRDSPTAFGASHDDEVHFTRGDLVHRVEPTKDSWLLAAFDDESAMVGCIGWYRDRGAKVSHKSHIWGMYVTPRHRRKGIACALVMDLIARGKSNTGVTQIELFVAAGNSSAACLYESVDTSG